jgi:hypothetical protein
MIFAMLLSLFGLYDAPLSFVEFDDGSVLVVYDNR